MSRTEEEATGEPGAIQTVIREAARFGYGDRGEIREISDPLPERYWQHPANTWSPLISTRIPGLDGVRLKYEASPLSGSFKDRIMTVTLSEILEIVPDCPGVVVPSSGNAAVAAAACCARIGLKMVAVVPSATPDDRIYPIMARGGLVVRGGEGPAAAYAVSYEIASELGYFPLHSTFSSPWAEWACRAIGREICSQLSMAPGMVVAPVSAGPVLVGTANGIREAGYGIPPLIAVQSAECAPIARAFEQGDDTVIPWTAPVETKASAIADRLSGYPQDGTRTLRLLRSTGGMADGVTDRELVEAREALFRYDGIDAELSACAAVAWLRRCSASRPANTVCLVTANGAKQTFAGDIPAASETHGHEIAERIAVLLKGRGVDATLVR